MKLELDKEFFIEIDDNNFTLFKKGITGEKSKVQGLETITPVGYYGTLQNALRDYTKYSLRLLENENVQEILNKLNSIEAIILKIK